MGKDIRHKKCANCGKQFKIETDTKGRLPSYCSVKCSAKVRERKRLAKITRINLALNIQFDSIENHPEKQKFLGEVYRLASLGALSNEIRQALTFHAFMTVNEISNNVFPFNNAHYSSDEIEKGKSNIARVFYAFCKETHDTTSSKVFTEGIKARNKDTVILNDIPFEGLSTMNYHYPDFDYSSITPDDDEQEFMLTEATPEPEAAILPDTVAAQVDEPVDPVVEPVDATVDAPAPKRKFSFLDDDEAVQAAPAIIKGFKPRNAFNSVTSDIDVSTFIADFTPVETKPEPELISYTYDDDNLDIEIEYISRQGVQ